MYTKKIIFQTARLQYRNEQLRFARHPVLWNLWIFGTTAATPTLQWQSGSGILNVPFYVMHILKLWCKVKRSCRIVIASVGQGEGQNAHKELVEMFCLHQTAIFERFFFLGNLIWHNILFPFASCWVCWCVCVCVRERAWQLNLFGII